MNIFEELLWPQFRSLEAIRNLPLDEQVAAYNQYVYDLSQARYLWTQNQPKGSRPGGPETTPEIEMLTEAGDVLTTESGESLIL